MHDRINELRNRVYRYALIDDSEMIFDFKKIHEKTTLFQTCSQLRQESSTIFHDENLFILEGTTHQQSNVEKVLENMPQEERQSFSVVTLRPRIPDTLKKFFNILFDGARVKKTTQETLKDVQKEFGLPEASTYLDALKGISANASLICGQLATILVEHGVNIESIAAMDRGDDNLDDPNSDPALEAHKKLLKDMAYRLGEAIVETYNKLYGSGSCRKSKRLVFEEGAIQNFEEV